MTNLRAHAHRSYAVTGALSSQRVALGRREGSVEVHALSTRAMTHARQLFVPGESSASALAFSPDGDVLAVFGSDGALVIWNLARNTLETHRIARTGGKPSLVFSSDASALLLILAGDVAMREEEPDGFVRMWSDPATDTLVARIHGGAMRQQVVEGAWEPLPGSPGLMQRTEGETQSVEAWRWDGDGVHRTPVTQANTSARIEALSASHRFALVHTSEGRVMEDRVSKSSAKLAESSWGEVLGFIDEETCLVFEYGPMLLGRDGTCTRVASSASQSTVLAGTRAFVLERSGFEREQLIGMQGEVHVLAERADTLLRACPSAHGLALVSYTPAQAHGAYSHAATNPACLLEGSRTVSPPRPSRAGLFHVAVSGDGRIAAGVDHEGTVHRWRTEDGAQLGEAKLFATEAAQGCLPSLTLDAAGSFAVEQNQLLRLFDLARLEQVSRFAFQKKLGEAPFEDPDQALDAKARRKLEAAWDSFHALRSPWNPSLTLSPDAAQLFMVDEGAVLSLTREVAGVSKKKRNAPPKDANALSFAREGEHVAFSTAEGAALFACAPFKQLAAWSRADAGRLADTDARWMVLTRDQLLEVCDATTGAVRWQCALPSFDQPGAADVYVHAEGARIALVLGGHVMVIEEGAFLLELVVLPDGELLATGRAGWWATPKAFSHAHLSCEGHAASTHADAVRMWGAPNEEVLQALSVTRR